MGRNFSSSHAPHDICENIVKTKIVLSNTITIRINEIDSLSRCYQDFFFTLPGKRHRTRISEKTGIENDGKDDERDNTLELIDELILMRVPIPREMSILIMAHGIFGNARSSVAHHRRIRDESMTAPIEFIPWLPPLYHYSDPPPPGISTLFHPLTGRRSYTFRVNGRNPLISSPLLIFPVFYDRHQRDSEKKAVTSFLIQKNHSFGEPPHSLFESLQRIRERRKVSRNEHLHRG